MNTEAVRTYITACNREHAECAQELVDTLNNNTKTALLGQRAVPLNDIDVCCIAEAIRALGPECSIKVFNLEENSFGLQGVQALMEAVESNPGRVKELRFGKNNLKDQAAIAIGHTLSRDGYGLKVLDLSENGITKLGVIPIAAALQHPTSDIVELSFHNNKIEGDAATFLCQAIRAAPKLKHLHLGYNALRDSGAVQLAKSLPQAKYLSTLDLTANRIGHDGGAAIAEALKAPTCTVQRLNLRHNQLDSDALALFAEVLRKNRSLIQLFLGFMYPTPDVAADVLDAVKENDTLLLLDIYGWKLEPKNAEPLLRRVQEGTGAIAAIVTDACQPFAASIDEGNIIRENRDMHPLYVGPDDRDAYLATKSLRRYSRAQSRRQSRVASARASRSRAEHEHSHVSRTSSRRRLESGNDEGSQGGGSRHGSRHHSRRHSHRHSRRSSRALSEATNNHLADDRAAGDAAASQPERRSRRERSGEAGALVPASRRRSSSRRHRTPRSGGVADDTASAATAPVGGTAEERARSIPPSAREASAEGPEAHREAERLLQALQETPCDAQTAAALAAIVKSIQSQLRRQRAQHRHEVRQLSARLDALEARRECLCGGVALNGNRDFSNGAGQPPQQQSQQQSQQQPLAHFARATGTSGFFGSSVNGMESSGRQPGPGSVYRSASRGGASEGGAVERAMTPLVHPNAELRDTLPELPRPNDESGERKPEEASLQRSASVQSFPPRIEPSPAQDANPPRRKSVAHIF